MSPSVATIEPTTSLPDTATVPQKGRTGLERWIRGLSYVGVVVNLVLLMRVLPVDRLVDGLSARVQAMGGWGPVAFALAYVVAALLFVPGSALTLAAGAVFGLFWGTVIVSVASTTAAALAFLIGRYLAREAVKRRASSSPRFAAIDRAIGEGGWKIIALLRLSPAIPFSLGNYLLGLTPIRFLPYVITSWIFMLPGTVMYVYLGHAGREGLSAATGGESAGRTAGEWALLVVGLLATIAVTVYVTRLARRALRSQTVIETDEAPTDAEKAPARPKRRWIGTVIPAAAFVLLLGVTVYAYSNRARLAYLFGPPAATLTERFEAKPDGPAFDHSSFDTLLRKYVDGAGFVDYEGLASESKQLDGYIKSLADAPPDELGRDQRLALLINAYNAFTLRLILDHWPVDSIRDIAAGERWDAVRWVLAGRTYSLNQIEHEEIRPNFKEPRIHFALVCAAAGCPPLRNEAYVGARLEAQLAAQNEFVHTHDRWFRYDARAGRVYLTMLYDWYGGDFEQVAGSVLAYAAASVPALKEALDAGRAPHVEFLEYDWQLNAQEKTR